LYFLLIILLYIIYFFKIYILKIIHGPLYITNICTISISTSYNETITMESSNKKTQFKSYINRISKLWRKEGQTTHDKTLWKIIKTFKILKHVLCYFKITISFRNSETSVLVIDTLWSTDTDTGIGYWTSDTIQTLTWRHQ
jgi:hypothetical protein